MPTFLSFALLFAVLSTSTPLRGLSYFDEAQATISAQKADEGEEIETTASEEGPSPSWWRTKFSFHGFLSAAYGESDGISFLGLPDDGTFDYWNAAAQLRFEPTHRDAIAVQLNHESLGDSSDSELRSDVELDWAIYQHRFGKRTWLRAGRLPIPYGIYNEVRDVGTLLPFYRPPVNIYRQGGSGMVVVETIDGLLLGRRTPLGRSWELEGEVYYGSFHLDEDLSIFGRGFVPTRVEDAFGATLWLETPLTGVRFGIGGFSSRLTGDVHRPDDRFSYLIASFEAVFDRYTVRAEYLTADADLLIAYVEPYRAAYVELGVALTRRLRLNLQGEHAEITVSLPPLISGLGFDFNDDLAAGLSFAFRPNLVAKVELHDNEGYLGEGIGLNPFIQPPKTRYGTLSFSASF